MRVDRVGLKKLGETTRIAKHGTLTTDLERNWFRKEMLAASNLNNVWEHANGVYRVDHDSGFLYLLRGRIDHHYARLVRIARDTDWSVIDATRHANVHLQQLNIDRLP